MGTKADFYSGKGVEAEWIGSIAFDGYIDGIPQSILSARTEDTFRAAVEELIRSRPDGTLPNDGWPWPWNDSSTTDCSYWFFDGATYEAVRNEIDAAEHVYKPVNCFARLDKVWFPDMSARKNVAWGERSGLIVVQANLVGVFDAAESLSNTPIESPSDSDATS